jgi:hypothetical protein
MKNDWCHEANGAVAAVVDDAKIGSMVLSETDSASACCGSDNEIVFVDFTRNSAAPIGRSVPTWVYMDSGAEASVFCNPELLTNIHEGKRMRIKTVAGSKSISKWGSFGPIKVMYDPDCDANLLAQHDLELVCDHIDYDFSENSFVCHIRESG